MKLLLLADGAVGLAIAEWLLTQYPADVALLVTTGDNDIAGAGRHHGIECHVAAGPVLEPRELTRGRSTFDLGITAWWPHLLSVEVSALPVHGFVNTHPSLLPHNRGKHYNFWALVEQCPFGVSLHKIGRGVDAGDIFAQRSIPYTWEDTGGSLYAKAQAAMVDLFRETYPILRRGAALSTPQDPGAGSYHRAAEIEAASRIDLDALLSGRQLLNLLRARTFVGKPASWFTDEGVEFEVRVDITRKVR